MVKRIALKKESNAKFDYTDLTQVKSVYLKHYPAMCIDFRPPQWSLDFSFLSKNQFYCF